MAYGGRLKPSGVGIASGISDRTDDDIMRLIGRWIDIEQVSSLSQESVACNTVSGMLPMLTTCKLELLIISSSDRCHIDSVKPLVSENWSSSIANSVFAGAAMRVAVFCASVNRASADDLCRELSRFIVDRLLRDSSDGADYGLIEIYKLALLFIRKFAHTNTACS